VEEVMFWRVVVTKARSPYRLRNRLVCLACAAGIAHAEALLPELVH
jgi:hypothetical protein